MSCPSTPIIKNFSMNYFKNPVKKTKFNLYETYNGWCFFLSTNQGDICLKNYGKTKPSSKEIFKEKEHYLRIIGLIKKEIISSILSM